MNKKFLSAILFGALMVTSTGTFVSCKDYDDDIKDLQEQIDKLATKEDMTSQIASLQAALTAAQSEATAAKTTAAQALEKANGIAATATEAEKAAAEASKAAAQAALDAAAAKEEAIKAAKEEVAKAQEALEKAIATNFEAVKEQLAKQIAELTKKVEDMTGYTTAMLTSLHILAENGYDASLDLNYARNTGNKKTIGGKGIAGTFEIATGEVNMVAGNMLVNIDPVNSVVTSDMLSLVNGKGVNLNEYVDMTIADYNNQIIKNGNSRAAGNGLRLVSVQLKKEVDFEAFDKLVLAGNEWHDSASNSCESEHDYIAYALAVTDAAKARTITSEYDVTMHVMAEPETGATATLSSSAVNWAQKPITDYSGKDVVGDEEDCFPIILGEDFNVKVLSATQGGHIMASYVCVDMDNSLLSVTDKAAISAMTFTGVDQIVKTGIHQISVNGTYAAGVAVPMNLVAYDYYGNETVIPFAIKANKAAEQTASFTLTPAKNVTIKGYTAEAWTPSAEDGDSELQAFTIPATATKYVVELIAGETEHGRDQKNKTNWFVSSVTTPKDATELTIADGIMADSKSVLKLYQSDKKTPATKNKNVAYAEFVGTLNLQLMKEDKTYTGLVTFYDATGTFLSSNAIEVTKVLPTTVPADFSAKTNAIENGVLTIYPTPASNGKGEFNLNYAFNNWTVEFNKITVKDVCTNVDANEKLTDNLLGIGNSVINDGKTYATTITYNYGEIKYKAEGHGVVNDLNCTVTWDEVFATKFGCYPIDCTYSWYNTPVVYYKEKATLDGHKRDEDGVVIEKRNVIKVVDPYNQVVNAFTDKTPGMEENPWGIWADKLNVNDETVELWTNGDNTKVNEYFTPSWEKKDGAIHLVLTPTSTNVVLSGDVEITVVLNVNDKFSSDAHKHQIKALTFTMKKEHPAE